MRKATRVTLKSGILIGLLSLPMCLLGQPNAGSVRPPVLGFVFDSGSYRPILGVPGASLLGATVDTGVGLTAVAVSPNQDYALAVAGDRREVVLIPLAVASNGAAAAAVDGALSEPDLMVLSPTGNSAAIYRRNGGLLQVLTGLPDSPHILREVPGTAAGEPITSLAVADDGRVVVGAVADNSLVIVADGIPRFLPLDRPVSAIAFRPRTHDAAIAGGPSAQAWLILRATDSADLQPLAGPDSGFIDPVAVEFSLDGRYLFVADAGNLIQLDTSGAPPQSFSCACNITGLHRLTGNSVFRLTDSSAGPLTIFDGDGKQPRIGFIPAAPERGSDGVQ